MIVLYHIDVNGFPKLPDFVVVLLFSNGENTRGNGLVLALLTMLFYNMNPDLLTPFTTSLKWS